jgi:hypothetical protein
MKLSVVWWNTSLSPPKRTATKKQRDIVCAMLKCMIDSYDADFIALGEVSDDDMEYIKDYAALDGFLVKSLVISVGKLKFDVSVLIRYDKLALQETENIISARADRNLKIAQRLTFNIAGFNQPVHIFVSHWNSRNSCSEAKRQILGTRLRDEVDELGTDIPVILMGDYNDEPFNDSLADGLLATRDRLRVNANKQLLYNPFWRHLGEVQPYKLQFEPRSKICGSYYYKSGTLSRWHTFDQIIVSSYFIGASQWHLNEELTGIMDIADFFELVIDSKEKFDHFPVIAVLEKEEVTHG